MTHRLLSLASLGALLIGCGQDIPPPPDIDPATNAVSFTGDLTPAGGQSIAVIGQVDDLRRVGLTYSWEQLEGPEVFIANPDSSVLAFEMPEDATARFRLTVTDIDGDSVAGELTLTAEGLARGIHVRRDHEVVEGNAVSLRLGRDHAIAHLMAEDPELTEEDAYLAVGEMDRNVVWRQIEGPEVLMDLENPERTLLYAPLVEQDTLLVFEVQEIIGIETYTDLVYVFVNDDPLVLSHEQSVVSLVHAYRPNSPWSEALIECVYSQHLYTQGICARERLPLLGMEVGGVPTIDDIMNRVVVSHDWMGQRFEEFLRDRDPHDDFRTLMSSVSAVVLSYDVRPSFYSSATTAIYLDPNNLWLLPEERDTLNEAPDYRSSFGEALQFLVVWRYVKDNEYAYTYPSLSRRIERDWDGVEALLASLLYHELAHATDYFPPEVFDSIEGETYVDALENRRGDLLSDRLTDSFPLSSSEMFELAQVRYRGVEATAEQSDFSPDNVATFFPPDRANSFYSYTSTREDLAMLFEELMMSHRYGIQQDIAITDRPEVLSASTITVAWGQRGRAAEPQLAERAAFAIDQVLPELDGTAVIDALPTPVPMRVGESWLDNLVPDMARSHGDHRAHDRPLMLDGMRYLPPRE